MAKKKPVPKKKAAAKKAPAPPEKKGPQARASCVVPEKAGGGEARLYDAWTQGLPEVLDTPGEQLMSEQQWWLVHFPSRRCVCVKGDRLEGLRHLKKLEKGEDALGLLPPLPGVKGRVTRVRAGAGEAQGGEDEPPPAVQPPVAPKVETTPVPEDADFDQAMQTVFPVARITAHFERLLTASEPVYDKEGGYVGDRPAFGVQFQTLKALTEWHQGRPTEKPKKKDERKMLTLQELREKMVRSPEYRAAMAEMVKDCEAAAQAAAAAAGAKT